MFNHVDVVFVVVKIGQSMKMCPGGVEKIVKCITY